MLLLVTFRGSERGRFPPMLHSVILKPDTMQTDPRQLKRMLYLDSFVVWTAEIGLSFLQFYRGGGGGKYSLKVPLACPQPCPALAKPVVSL